MAPDEPFESKDDGMDNSDEEHVDELLQKVNELVSRVSQLTESPEDWRKSQKEKDEQDEHRVEKEATDSDHEVAPSVEKSSESGGSEVWHGDSNSGSEIDDGGSPRSESSEIPREKKERKSNKVIEDLEAMVFSFTPKTTSVSPSQPRLSLPMARRATFDFDSSPRRHTINLQSLRKRAVTDDGDVSFADLPVTSATSAAERDRVRSVHFDETVDFDEISPMSQPSVEVLREELAALQERSVQLEASVQKSTKRAIQEQERLKRAEKAMVETLEAWNRDAQQLQQAQARALREATRSTELRQRLQVREQELARLRAELAARHAQAGLNGYEVLNSEPVAAEARAYYPSLGEQVIYAGHASRHASGFARSRLASNGHAVSPARRRTGSPVRPASPLRPIHVDQRATLPPNLRVPMVQPPDQRATQPVVQARSSAQQNSIGSPRSPPPYSDHPVAMTQLRSV